MNDSNTNAGGWNGCSKRKTLYGNSGTPTSPISNSLMAALPSDLRAVMQPVTKYTDNTGNSSNSSGNVTATRDYLFDLAEFEVFGVRNYANQYEQNSQQQYAYYKAGNSKVANNHTAVNTAVWWWLRSPFYSNLYYFVIVWTDGAYNYIQRLLFWWVAARLCRLIPRRMIPPYPAPGRGRFREGTPKKNKNGGVSRPTKF